VVRAELDKQPSDVRRMFDAVARRYDFSTAVLSLGQYRQWL
jgi:demethylmenaquinone methyltransferase/2-methoxy-6-polyprenyl-1,4-benzoquinol methylase